MNDNKKLTEAGLQYATAYAMHYKMKDMHSALKLYREVITAYPDAKEAEYSKSQIQNIVNAMVPNLEALDALMELAFTYLKRERPPVVERGSIKQPASK